MMLYIKSIMSKWKGQRGASIGDNICNNLTLQTFCSLMWRVMPPTLLYCLYIVYTLPSLFEMYRRSVAGKRVLPAISTCITYNLLVWNRYSIGFTYTLSALGTTIFAMYEMFLIHMNKIKIYTTYPVLLTNPLANRWQDEIRLLSLIFAYLPYQTLNTCHKKSLLQFQGGLLTLIDAGYLGF